MVTHRPYGLPDVAEKLGLSETRVRTLARRGELPGATVLETARSRLGYRFDAAVIDSLIRQGWRPGQPVDLPVGATSGEANESEQSPAPSGEVQYLRSVLEQTRAALTERLEQAAGGRAAAEARIDELVRENQRLRRAVAELSAEGIASNLDALLQRPES